LNYRPICDTWILARPKVAYYGSYPSGFLTRARQLLGVDIRTPVLHVCSGKVQDYDLAVHGRQGVGFGPHDCTLDLDPSLNPTYCQDCRDPLPPSPFGTGGTSGGWPAILADPPYSREDAAHYRVGSDTFPSPKQLLHNCLKAVCAGGRVGFLHFVAPRPPKEVAFIALVGVFMGYDNQARWYSVYEKRA
jgi:hypothetical protein